MTIKRLFTNSELNDKTAVFLLVLFNKLLVELLIFKFKNVLIFSLFTFEFLVVSVCIKKQSRPHFHFNVKS